MKILSMLLILMGLFFFSCKEQLSKVDCKENKILLFKGGVFFQGQIVELSVDSQVLYKKKFRNGYSNDQLQLVNTFCTNKNLINLRFKLSQYDTLIQVRLDGIDTIVFQSDYNGQPYINMGEWPDA